MQACAKSAAKLPQNLLQSNKIIGSLRVAGSTVYLDAAVCPSLCQPGDVLLQPVHVRVLGGVGAGLLNGGADVLHVLLREKKRSIIETIFFKLFLLKNLND